MGALRGQALLALGAHGRDALSRARCYGQGSDVTAYRRPFRPRASIPSRIEVATVTACPCGKAIHRSRSAARRFARQHHPAGDVRPYICPHNPDAWHLGHLPPAVIAGDLERAEVRQGIRPAPRR